jgi:predicted transcriptional regulator
MTQVSLSFRAPSERSEALDSLCAATHRSRSWHLEQALSRYLEAQQWQIERISAGLAQAHAGDVVDHDTVAGWIDSWGDDVEKPQPR